MPRCQIGWMAFVVLFIFWMWLYEVRMLLAIFLGFKSFSSIDAFLTVVTTTTEGLGFTGRKEGIAAQAVAMVRLP